MIRVLLYMMSFWLALGPVLGQKRERTRWVDAEDDLRGASWRFKAGDSLRWADPAYEPLHWEHQSPTNTFQVNKALWKAGKGWFRMAFRMRPSALGKDMQLVVQQFGRSEIFLDGRLLATVKPAQFDSGGSQRVIQFVSMGVADTSRHVLAIRYQFRRDPVLFDAVDIAPMYVYFRTANEAGLSLLKDRWSILGNVFFTSVFAILALLHGLFYRVNRNQRIHYTLAWMMLSFALAFSIGELYNHTATLTQQAVVDLLEEVLICLGFILLLTTAYQYLHLRRGRAYYLLVGIAVANLVYEFSISQRYGSLGIMPLLLILTDYVRLGWIGRRRGDADSRLPWRSIKTALYCVGLIMVYSVVLVILELTTNNNFDSSILIPIFLLVVVILFSIPVGLSLSLVRDYARTYQALSDNLREVQQLSARTLAQEQEKQQILATQNDRLEQQVRERTAELHQSLEELKATQEQLVQREKLASLGELTAGIAHEIQNPLNFVNNFAEVSVELLDELHEERARPTHRDEDLETELLEDLKQNVQKISEHGKRAASIVRGMLQHSRASSGQKEPTDLNALVDEYQRLAYHGMRAKDKGGPTGRFNVYLETALAPDLPLIKLVKEDMGRVLVNLFNNAFYAVDQQAKTTDQSNYRPTVWVSTAAQADTLVIRIRDNGTGIPAEVARKVFQPFFTTKPTGQGTGLGLSLSYDIVTKGHGGTMTLTSEPGLFTEFVITLPVT
ncbi:ATP-binding protein [Rudanella paleaurantiibacter]|nr:ATP-binding protein [Rudanella paleaurantiibacter]